MISRLTGKVACVERDRLRFADRDGRAVQAIQSRLRKAFDPYVNFILAGGNIFEVNILVLIRGRIIRRGERKHHRAHLGVNVGQ